MTAQAKEAKGGPLHPEPLGMLRARGVLNFAQVAVKLIAPTLDPACLPKLLGCLGQQAAADAAVKRVCFPGDGLRVAAAHRQSMAQGLDVFWRQPADALPAQHQGLEVRRPFMIDLLQNLAQRVVVYA